MKQQTTSNNTNTNSEEYLDEENSFITHNECPQYLMDISHYRKLSPEEEVEIAKRVEIGDEAAREILIKANMWYVYWQVYYTLKRIEHNPDSFMDMVQEGNVGLVMATYKFDYRYGVRFCTFAASTIRRYVYNAVNLAKSNYRITSREAYRYNRINTVKYKLSVVLGREPTNDEIAEEMNISLHTLTNIINQFQPMKGLEDEDFVICFWDESMNETDPTADKGITAVLDADIHKRIEEILNGLTLQEKQVIQLSYGFIGGRVYTTKEITAILNITRQRVEYVKQHALNKILEKMTAADYQLFKNFL